MTEEKKTGNGVLTYIIAVLFILLIAYLVLNRQGSPAADGTEGVSDVSAPAVTLDGWCSETGKGECLPKVCRENDRNIVLFYAEWCGWCQKLRKETLVDPRVKEALQGYGRVLVDGTKDDRWAPALGADGFPAIFLFDPKCTARVHIGGFVDADELLKYIGEFEKGTDVPGIDITD